MVGRYAGRALLSGEGLDVFVCSLVTVYVDLGGDAMEFGHGGLALCGRAASSERRSRLVGGLVMDRIVLLYHLVIQWCVVMRLHNTM